MEPSQLNLNVQSESQDSPKSKNGQSQQTNHVTSANETRDTPIPDGGWGWMVLFGSFIVNAAVFGTINSFGILYVELRDKYGSDNPNISSKAALVGSLAFGMTNIMGTISGIVSDKIGIRRTGIIGSILASIGMICSAFVEDLVLLYLTFSVIMGIGFGFVYNQSLVILGHYFKRHLGIVYGICSFGGNVSAIGLTLGLPPLFNEVGLRYTFLIMSILVILTLPSALTWTSIFTSHTFDSGNDENRVGCFQRYLNVSIWRNKPYIIFSVSVAVAASGYSILFVHLVKYAEDEFPDNDSSHLLLYLIASSSAAQLVMGKIGDSQYISRLRMLQGSLAVFGVCMAIIPYIGSYSTLIPVVLLIGLCCGAYICLPVPIQFEIVGEKNASQAVGFYLGMLAIPNTASPSIAGLIYDKTGSYNVAFYLAGGCMVAGMICMFLVRIPSPDVQNQPLPISTQDVTVSFENEKELYTSANDNKAYDDVTDSVRKQQSDP